ncbi:BON domain-containing protein [Lysobacter sp. P5_B9]
MNMKPVAMSVAIALAVSTGAVFAQQAGSTEHQTSNDASEVVSDAWITSKIKADLLAAHETPGMAIDVDTKDGAVTLNGTVKSQAEADKAVAHAKTIKGVKHVTSKLKVEPVRK